IGLVPGHSRARVSLSRDGRALVATLELFIRENVLANAGLILNVDRPGERPRIIRGAFSSIAVSPDAKWVATTVENAYEGKVWDAQPGRWVKDFPGVRTALAAFSPDNRWLVFATARWYLFYQVGSWQPGPRLKRDYTGYWPCPVAFSHDGTLAAIAQS